MKLHRAGVVAQDADFDNGRQQAAAPHVDSVAGGGVVRGDSHIADKRIGDSEPEVNARPFAKNDQLMANGGRMGRLNSAAGRDVAAGGQGHHAGEEKDGDDGAVKDARDEHDDSLRPIGQVHIGLILGICMLCVYVVLLCLICVLCVYSTMEEMMVEMIWMTINSLLLFPNLRLSTILPLPCGVKMTQCRTRTIKVCDICFSFHLYDIVI